MPTSIVGKLKLLKKKRTLNRPQRDRTLQRLFNVSTTRTILCLNRSQRDRTLQHLLDYVRHRFDWSQSVPTGPYFATAKRAVYRRQFLGLNRSQRDRTLQRYWLCATRTCQLAYCLNRSQRDRTLQLNLNVLYFVLFWMRLNRSQRDRTLQLKSCLAGWLFRSQSVPTGPYFATATYSTSVDQPVWLSQSVPTGPYFATERWACSKTLQGADVSIGPNGTVLCNACFAIAMTISRVTHC